MELKKIKILKKYVIYSNFLAIPWLLIGLQFIDRNIQWVLWFITFLVFFKGPLFIIIPKVNCPTCRHKLAPNGISLAFLKKCDHCSQKID